MFRFTLMLVFASRAVFCERSDVFKENTALAQKVALAQELHDYITANIDNICKTNDQAGHNSSLTLLTIAAGLPEAYMNVLQADRQNLAKHNDGAEVCIVDHRLNNTRDYAWSKVVAVRTLLELGRQHIVWMDADALAFNPRSFAEIEDKFLPAKKSILFTSDFDERYDADASPRSSINSGVFITHNTAWSAHFWKSVWEDFPEAINDAWWDQRAVLLFRKAFPKEFADNTQIIPYRIMNTCVNAHKPGDFITHWAGGHGETKYDELLRMSCVQTQHEWPHMEAHVLLFAHALLGLFLLFALLGQALWPRT